MCLQAAVRGHYHRMAYLHVMAAVLTIQIALRRWQLNRRVSLRTAERQSREARAASVARAEAERDAAERAAIEDKQRQERASFAAIKVSCTPAESPWVGLCNPPEVPSH